MKALSTLWFALLLACVVGATASAATKAPPVSAADARAVRTVIESQLDAFAADEAERAFSFAAPSIRQMFGTSERFMAMVKRGYPVVYRPASVAFLKPLTIEGGVLQEVQLTDADGEVWIASYRMQRQRDRSWRIGGVELAQGQARAI